MKLTLFNQIRSYAANAGRFMVASVLPVSAVFLTGLQLIECSGGNFSSTKLNMKERPGNAIPMSLTYRPPTTLNLEGGGSSDLGLVSTATDLYVTVSGCASGYTLPTEFKITSGVVNLYKGDQNCLVKLTKFTLGTDVYSATGSGTVAFTTWLAGNVATFLGTASGTDLIKVFVISQVTQGGVTTSDTISYAFTDIASGATNNVTQANVSTAVPLSASGKQAPNYSIFQARYLTTNSNGSASMSLTVACGSNVTGSSGAYTCPNSDGSGDVQTTHISYIMIPDAYSACAGSPTALTVAQANSFFASPPSGTSVYTITDGDSAQTAGGVGAAGQIAAGAKDNWAQTIATGGFDTAAINTGNVPIYPSNLNEVFMIRRRDSSGNALSYLYQCVDIASITQL